MNTDANEWTSITHYQYSRERSLYVYTWSNWLGVDGSSEPEEKETHGALDVTNIPYSTFRSNIPHQQTCQTKQKADRLHICVFPVHLSLSQLVLGPEALETAADPN